VRRRSSPLALALGAVLVVAPVAGLGIVAFDLLPNRGLPLSDGPIRSFDPPPAGTEVLLGAGDIARCDADGDEATARILDRLEGTIFTAGDNGQHQGSPDEFRRCYAPTWGRHLDRTGFPAAGNHDWDTAGAAGYLGYFGERAAPEGATWYSRDLGDWHVIVLDSECEEVGGCGEGSPQAEWLRKDLAASDAACTMAIWHRPRFSSGQHGDDTRTEGFWRLLYDAGAELIVNGHDHSYERFAPQDPLGRADGARGIRQIVAGTGGTFLRSFNDVKPNSEVRESDSHGVLRLELRPDSYAWTFVPVAGGTFTDEGTATCH
jgi:hypothetical protein